MVLIEVGPPAKEYFSTTFFFFRAHRHTTTLFQMRRTAMAYSSAREGSLRRARSPGACFDGLAAHDSFAEGRNTSRSVRARSASADAAAPPPVSFPVQVLRRFQDDRADAVVALRDARILADRRRVLLKGEYDAALARAVACNAAVEAQDKIVTSAKVRTFSHWGCALVRKLMHAPRRLPSLRPRAAT